MKYLQLHIQFFRAISVLLVFFYHLEFEYFKYGYLNEFIDKTHNHRTLFYNSYDKICPNDICYSYNNIKDLLSHRDISHLTIEGSVLLENNFLEFYTKYYTNNIKNE